MSAAAATGAAAAGEEMDGAEAAERSAFLDILRYVRELSTLSNRQSSAASTTFLLSSATLRAPLGVQAVQEGEREVDEDAGVRVDLEDDNGPVWLRVARPCRSSTSPSSGAAAGRTMAGTRMEEEAKLYKRLFALYQAMSHASIECVWGTGMVHWRYNETAGGSGSGSGGDRGEEEEEEQQEDSEGGGAGGVSGEIHAPLIELLVELEMDPRDGAILVRPREQVVPTLNLNIFDGAVQAGRISSSALERLRQLAANPSEDDGGSQNSKKKKKKKNQQNLQAARPMLQQGAISPFAPASFREILSACALQLSDSGEVMLNAPLPEPGTAPRKQRGSTAAARSKAKTKPKSKATSKAKSRGTAKGKAKGKKKRRAVDDDEEDSDFVPSSDDDAPAAPRRGARGAAAASAASAAAPSSPSDEDDVSVTGGLDENALIDPLTIHAPDHLVVTDHFTLFARSRSDNAFVQDVQRLIELLQDADSSMGPSVQLPECIRKYVRPPRDHIEAEVHAAREQVFGSSLSDVHARLAISSISLSSAAGAGVGAGGDDDDRGDLFLPLPTNPAQRSIVEKLREHDGVVVEGPPGTGKTHTIANIVCHCLAMGQRVLVTAKGEAAIEAIHSLLPDPIRDLSISLTSTETQGFQQLENVVYRLANRISQVDPRKLRHRVLTAMSQLNTLSQEIARVDDEVERAAEQQLQPVAFPLDQPFKGLAPTKLAEVVLVERRRLGLPGFRRSSASPRSDHGVAVASPPRGDAAAAREGGGIGSGGRGDDGGGGGVYPDSWFTDTLEGQFETPPRLDESTMEELRDLRYQVGKALLYRGTTFANLSAPISELVPTSAEVGNLYDQVNNALRVLQATVSFRGPTSSDREGGAQVTEAKRDAALRLTDALPRIVELQQQLEGASRTHKLQPVLHTPQRPAWILKYADTWRSLDSTIAEDILQGARFVAAERQRFNVRPVSLPSPEALRRYVEQHGTAEEKRHVSVALASSAGAASGSTASLNSIVALFEPLLKAMHRLAEGSSPFPVVTSLLSNVPLLGSASKSYVDDLSALLAAVSVGGSPASTADEWQWAIQYLTYRERVMRVCREWNQLYDRREQGDAPTPTGSSSTATATATTSATATSSKVSTSTTTGSRKRRAANGHTDHSEDASDDDAEEEEEEDKEDEEGEHADTGRPKQRRRTKISQSSSVSSSSGKQAGGKRKRGQNRSAPKVSAAVVEPDRPSFDPIGRCDVIDRGATAATFGAEPTAAAAAAAVATSDHAAQQTTLVSDLFADDVVEQAATWVDSNLVPVLDAIVELNRMASELNGHFRQLQLDPRPCFLASPHAASTVREVRTMLRLLALVPAQDRMTGMASEIRHLVDRGPAPAIDRLCGAAIAIANANVDRNAVAQSSATTQATGTGLRVSPVAGESPPLWASALPEPWASAMRDRASLERFWEEAVDELHAVQENWDQVRRISDLAATIRAAGAPRWAERIEQEPMVVLAAAAPSPSATLGRSHSASSTVSVPGDGTAAASAEMRTEDTGGFWSMLRGLGGSTEDQGRRRVKALRPVGAEDPVIPSNWRRMWELRRAEAFLRSIDARHRVNYLSDRRRELVKEKERTLLSVVELRIQMQLRASLSEAAQSALVRFLTALTHAGSAPAAASSSSSSSGSGKSGSKKGGRAAAAPPVSVRASRYQAEARNALQRCFGAVPCWILPMWRISQFVPAEMGVFDLVVVDEASQCDVTALPAICRARRILVVGDARQVSPTEAFFKEERIEALQRQLSTQFFSELMLPGRSLFDLSCAVFPTSRVVLTEHFRCAPPIIAYSNRHFYSGQLIPLRVPTPAERLVPTLVDVYVQNGARDKKRNRPEANAIVSEIMRLSADPHTANRTIGVISLIGSEQAKYIEARLLDHLSDAAFLRHQIICGDPSVLQGNERDIVFLSMVAAPGQSPTQIGLAYGKRYNVAMSRARDRMYVFRSIQSTDVANPQDFKLTVMRFFSESGSGAAADGSSSHNNNNINNSNCGSATSTLGQNARVVITDAPASERELEDDLAADRANGGRVGRAIAECIARVSRVAAAALNAASNAALITGARDPMAGFADGSSEPPTKRRMSSSMWPWASSSSSSGGADSLSTLAPDVDVAAAIRSRLERMGYRTSPLPLDVGGLTLDVVVEAGSGRGRGRLGIVIDGVAGGGAALDIEAWRESTVQQHVVERSGWVVWRVWKSSYLSSPDDCIADLDDQLDRLDVHPDPAVADAAQARAVAAGALPDPTTAASAAAGSVLRGMPGFTPLTSALTDSLESFTSTVLDDDVDDAERDHDDSGVLDGDVPVFGTGRGGGGATAATAAAAAAAAGAVIGRSPASSSTDQQKSPGRNRAATTRRGGARSRRRVGSKYTWRADSLQREANALLRDNGEEEEEEG